MTTGSTSTVKTDGTAWLWGAGNYGGLGLGNTTNYSSPVQLGALTTWSKVTSGKRFKEAIKTDGTLWAWGGNSFGALGDGTETARSSPVQIGALTTWVALSQGDEQFHNLALKTP
jgi:alpha-tubulin suppressor-like RCC1 family protein